MLIDEFELQKLLDVPAISPFVFFFGKSLSKSLLEVPVEISFRLNFKFRSGNSCYGIHDFIGADDREIFNAQVSNNRP